MAHLLEGNSGHKSYAPLSHAQTVELAHHLNNKSTNLELKVEELYKALQRTDANVNELQQGLHTMGTSITAVRSELGDTNTVLEGTRGDLERCGTNVHTLGMGIDMVKENVDALRDGQKHTNTNVKNLRDDLIPTQANVKAIQEHLERQSTKQIEACEAEIAETKRVLQRLISEHSLTRTDLGQETEKIRELKESLKDAMDIAKGVRDSVDVLEGKFLETKETLRQSKIGLEETNGIVVKIHEDHETTKNSLHDCNDKLHRAALNIKKLDDGLDKTSKALTKSQTDLSKATARVEMAHEVLGYTVDHVNSLREGHTMAQSSLAHLEQSLERTHRLAHQTKSVVHETNAILLPNLHMGENDTTSAAALGSAATSSSPPRPKGSPGKSKPRTPRTGPGSHLRSLGTAPNRMAMI